MELTTVPPPASTKMKGSFSWHQSAFVFKNGYHGFKKEGVEGSENDVAEDECNVPSICSHKRYGVVFKSTYLEELRYSCLEMANCKV